jgi:hypothetical protein
MENTKIISKEYYRNHVLCFSELLSPAENTSASDNTSSPENQVPTSETMCIGEVFKANERIAYCESVDKDSARQYCRQIVDTCIAQASAEHPVLQPEQTDLGLALLAVSEQLDARLRGILQAHWRNRNQALSIDLLKQAGALESTTAVYLAYAELARLLCDAINHIPVTPGSGQDPYLSMIIETVEPDIHTSDSLSLRLKPSVFTALEPFFSA